jgi:hypothetical protein
MEKELTKFGAGFKQLIRSVKGEGRGRNCGINEVSG